jgi:hypothetical protein
VNVAWKPPFRKKRETSESSSRKRGNLHEYLLCADVREPEVREATQETIIEKL